MPWRWRSTGGNFNAEINEGWRRVTGAMNRVMPEINRRQAMVIEGAHVLPNDRGTAPGNGSKRRRAS